MRRLLFVTQQVDPAHPALGATVAKIEALAARVDELVVIADGVVPGVLPENARARVFRARSRAGRGMRFEAALVRELAPRPLAVVAHMCPIYAVLAAPLVRPLRIPLALWFTHWKASRTLQLAERVSTRVLSVDTRTFPVRSTKLVPIGHGIDVSDFACTPPKGGDTLRALALGRTSAAKGLATIVEATRLARTRGADVELDVYGPSLSGEERAHRGELELMADEHIRVHDAVPRSEIPALIAASDCLVNNMREGATDKVVYEAAASCRPVLASNRAFGELLAGYDLAYARDDPAQLAERLVALAAMEDPARAELGRTLRERVVSGHSVEAWADKLLGAVA